MYRTHLVSGLCAELQEQVGRATGQGGAPRFTIRCVFEPELGVLARGDAVAGAYSGATARRWTEDLSLKHGGGGGGGTPTWAAAPQSQTESALWSLCVEPVAEVEPSTTKPDSSSRERERQTHTRRERQLTVIEP